MSLDRRFHQYFAALDRASRGDRSSHGDRCYLCRRTPADVKLFFGFREDGTPLDAARYGIEDVVLEPLDIMSYSGSRPVCAVCQLNFDSVLLCGELEALRMLLREMEEQRDRLWPSEETPASGDAASSGESG